MRIWSRETGSAVPSRVSLLISILRLNLVLTYGIPPECRGGVHLFDLNRHTPSGQSRVCRVTQLRTDGVRCRESAGTGPVNLKVVPNECTWSAEQGKEVFSCPRSCLRIWSRETDSAVPSRVSLRISVLRLNLVLTYGIPPGFRGVVHLFDLNRHTPSGQSRVYRVTQLRTDGVHCRKSTGTGPANLKVVPNECCLSRSPWTN